jgi:chitinase
LPVQFASANKLTADANVATKQQRVNSVSNFARTFSTAGASYPFTMVGNDPRQGGTTKIGTSLVMIQFFFDEFTDMNGNNIVLDASTLTQQFLNGPNFQSFAYGTGNTQFSDSVQRAEFYNVMKPGWHTLLGRPRVLPTVQIEVPVGLSFVFQAGQGGPYFALIDDGFFISQLNTILQFEPFELDELAIVLTYNALFYQGGSLSNCCILGYHTAIDKAVRGNKHDVQTFATASWVDRCEFHQP